MSSIKSFYQDNEGFSVTLDQYRIRSVFQPIYHLQGCKLFGYEALVRCSDSKGRNISPEKLFDPTHPKISRIKIDLIIATLHAINYRKYKDTITGKLFININPVSIAYLYKHQRTWQTMLKCVYKNSISNSQYDDTNVVIEIVEEESQSNTDFIKQLSALRRKGYIIAIDDFGSGHSNLTRVKKVKPHIVKLDKSILAKLRSEHIDCLPTLKEKLSLDGKAIVMEGIETAVDLDIAKRFGVEFVQGYYLGSPSSYPQCSATIE